MLKKEMDKNGRYNCSNCNTNRTCFVFNLVYKKQKPKKSNRKIIEAFYYLSKPKLRLQGDREGKWGEIWVSFSNFAFSWNFARHHLPIILRETGSNLSEMRNENTIKSMPFCPFPPHLRNL